MEWAEGELKTEWAKAETFARKEEAGEILVNFGGHFRVMGMSGNCQYWVVSPEGDQRDPDEVSYRKRYTSEGEKFWRLVGPTELALAWSCGTGRDVAGSSSFTVVKPPIDGCTEAQKKAVAQIEDELDVPRNAFSLHPEIQVLYDRRLEAIRGFCEQSRVLRKTPELDYLQVSGNWGQSILEESVIGNIGDHVHWNGEFFESCENRDAQVVEIAQAEDGMVELLAYDKWGNDNLNIRWRPLREDEVEQLEPEPKEPVKPLEADALQGGLAALMGKFNK